MMNETFPVDRLGPYPVLQLAAAILVLALVGVSVYRGTRDRNNAIPQRTEGQASGEQRWFFDGPLAQAINLLRDIKNHLDRLVELQDKNHELLRDIKGEVENLPSRRKRQ